MKTSLRLASVLGLGLALLINPSFAFVKSDAATKRAETRQMRDAVLDELYKLHPEAKAKIKHAEGYAVFSNIGVNVVIASFAGGTGIVVKHGLITNTETFMRMGSAGIGLGLGLKDFRGVFIFYDAAKLDAFVKYGWDFTGQADAAAKSDEKGAAITGAATVIPGVEIYQITKNGIALQATLQGTKYWKNSDLN
jgi:lipid-binding SYLF domain-containing protein